jgi:hypothetical protein
MSDPRQAGGVARRLSRRQVLVGGATALVIVPWLAACGDDEAGTASSSTDGHGAHGGLTGEGTGSMVMTAVFDANGSVVTGTEQRLPLGLVDAEGALMADGPDTLVVTVADLGGNPIGEPIEVARHAEGISLGYYPLRTTFEVPGLYRLEAEVDGTPLSQTVQANEPHTLNLLQPGDALPSLATPTTEDDRGVVPICTRFPDPCPFHDRSLDEVVANGRPTVVMVSTPAYCHIGICGPTLDLLVDLVEERRLDADVVHLEVYTDAEANGGPDGATPAPIMAELGLSWEPSMWIADGDGTVLERIDFAFDRDEIGAALDVLG